MSRNLFLANLFVIGMWSLLTPSSSFAGKESVLVRTLGAVVSRVASVTAFRPFSTSTPHSSAQISASAHPKKQVLAAVVETGFGYRPNLTTRHFETQDLKRKNDRQKMFLEDTTVEFFNKSLKHGTAVSGLVVRGVDEVKILPVLAALDYSALRAACKAGASVVNMSNYSNNPVMRQELAEIIQEYKNVLFIIAAANDGKDMDWTPKFDSSFSFSNLIFVAATENHKRGQFPSSEMPPLGLARFSNYGKNSVHVATVGQDLPVLLPDRGESVASGTSLAAPLTANLCVKMELIDPSLTAQEKIQILKETVIKTPNLRKKLIWGGVLNEEAALNRVRARKAVTDNTEKSLILRHEPSSDLEMIQARNINNAQSSK